MVGGGGAAGEDIFFVQGKGGGSNCWEINMSSVYGDDKGPLDRASPCKGWPLVFTWPLIWGVWEMVCSICTLICIS